MGGGKVSTLDAFDALGRSCSVFIAHDFDHDNTRLCGRAVFLQPSTTTGALVSPWDLPVTVIDFEGRSHRDPTDA